jgi:hypothetical protein
VTAEAWIRARVAPTGAIEVAYERPWATVLRVPVAGGAVWFKARGRVQAFEPRLSARLFEPWPDRVAEVIDHDGARAWLLLADAGAPVAERGNPPEAWLAALPAYAECSGARQRTSSSVSRPVFRTGGSRDFRSRWTICCDVSCRSTRSKSRTTSVPAAIP